MAPYQTAWNTHALSLMFDVKWRCMHGYSAGAGDVYLWKKTESVRLTNI